jgi:endoglucanase
MTTAASSRYWRFCLAYVAVICTISQGEFSLAFGAEHPTRPLASSIAFEQNKRLGRGINILGYDPIWKSTKDARFQEGYFQLIRDAGFDHVRINLHPFRDATADGDISGGYWKTLDWTIQHALDNKLAVILDFHEFLEMAKAPMAKKEQYLAVWRQIARRYKDAPNEVFFEILNEPNGDLTPSLWNQWLREALAIIRQTNPNRTVIVGPGHWNSIDLLEELDLPQSDQNLILTVHYYNPFAFTHQGAPWTEYKDKIGVIWKGDEQERRVILRDFDRAQAWATQHRRPLYLGEFGVYDKADMPSRVRYLGFVAREAERRGWSWAYWQFDSDFVLYDVPNGRWIRPLLEALIPRPSN